jgi:hypothetical protein
MNSFDEEFPNDQAIVREVEERGAKRERERIIALLDDAKSSYKLPISSELFQQIRALIKGENK